jgi:hypothetical protein
MGIIRIIGTDAASYVLSVCEFLKGKKQIIVHSESRTIPVIQCSLIHEHYGTLGSTPSLGPQPPGELLDHDGVAGYLSSCLLNAFGLSKYMRG